MTKRRYTYTILRYVHDPLTAEFINVGVVLFCPAIADTAPVLEARTRKTIGRRMRDMFPDLDRTAFTSAMRTIDGQLERIAREIGFDDLLQAEENASSFARRVLPDDDTSLQWSPVGSGLSENIEQAFDRLYARFVSRYDTQIVARRSDEDVWRPVRDRITERALAIELQPHVVSGEDDSIVFQNAWKNGAWHVYEPVSLDMADAEGIARKAYRWLGQLTSLDQSPEMLQANFIVGAPVDPQLQSAYRHALRILGKPMNVTVFEEADIERFVAKIEEEAHRHSVHAQGAEPD